MKIRQSLYQKSINCVREEGVEDVGTRDEIFGLRTHFIRKNKTCVLKVACLCTARVLLPNSDEKFDLQYAS